MKKIHLQIIAGTIIIGVIGILGLDYYQNNFPKKSISEYYAILDNYERQNYSKCNNSLFTTAYR